MLDTGARLPDARCPDRGRAARAPRSTCGSPPPSRNPTCRAEQKPDLQDGLRAYAGHAGLDVVQSYCDVAVSGRQEGRP